MSGIWVNCSHCFVVADLKCRARACGKYAFRYTEQGLHSAREPLSFQIYQSWLDKSTPYTAVRWVVTLGLSFVYMIRVYLLQVGVGRGPKPMPSPCRPDVGLGGVVVFPPFLE